MGIFTVPSVNLAFLFLPGSDGSRQNDRGSFKASSRSKLRFFPVVFLPHPPLSRSCLDIPWRHSFISPQARTSAAQSRLEAANQYSEDLRAVVVSAASAAAEAAVKSSIAKAQKTPKSRASDSYTDYTPSSYTRTQTSRSVTERTGGSGAAYTTDEFDSYVDSGQDRTQSL